MQFSDFEHPAIDSEYRRWMKKLESVEPGSGAGDDSATLSASEVLRAHFLVAEFFVSEKNGLGGIGPRDRNGDLLQSALLRQFVGFGGAQKWGDDHDIAATALYGLIKNHPFHDGNKRTALLSVLHLLEKQNYTASADKRRFEGLTVAVANNGYRKNSLYKYLQSEYANPNDTDVAYISARLKQMTRPLDRSHRSLTYRQLNGLLKDRGYEMKSPRDNKIGIVKIDNSQVIGHIGFPGMSKKVARGVVKKARAICKLSPKDGFDSRAFYNGAGGMDSLLLEYAEPLRRLADK